MSNDSSRPSGAGTTSGRRIEELSPAKLALLAQLRGRAGAFRIPRRAAGSPAPASFAQELLWQLDRSTPGTAIYNASRALRLSGPVDIAVLERSVTALV